MFAAVRPLAVSGAILLAANGIGSAPTEPVASVARVEHSAVALAAAPSPFEFYPQVIGRTLQNAGTLSAMYFADPFPITRVILANQTAALSDAVTALVNGDPEAALTALVGAITAPRKISEGLSAYIQDTYNQPYQDLVLAVVAVSPLVNGLAAAGVAIKDVIDAAVAFDLLGVVSAVVNIPARIVDGVLNGGYSGSWPGLLSPYAGEDVSLGPLSALVHLDQGTAARIPRWSSAETSTVREDSTVESEERSTADVVDDAVNDVMEDAVSTDEADHVDEDNDGAEDRVSRKPAADLDAEADSADVGDSVVDDTESDADTNESDAGQPTTDVADGSEKADERAA